MASRKRFGCFFVSFSDGHTAAFRRRRHHVVTAVSRLVAPNSIHHTSLDSHCAGQVKHSLARFNQTVIILISNFSKLEKSDHSVAAVRGPHLASAYRLNGLSGYR